MKIRNDKFYTKDKIAKMLVDMVDMKKFDTIIEPSAGDGAISKLIPGCIAYDLVPEDSSILQQDFLKFDASRFKGRILIIGNPPYGKNCSMAIKFFNKAATFADTIAFIVPKSLKKDSIQDKLDRNFHLVKTVDLPKNSFLANGEEYDVPSCIQIWERRRYQRPLSKKVSPIGFRFVKKEEADIAIRRVGGRAGKATTDTKGSTSTNTFISLDNKSQVGLFLEMLNSFTWEFNNTVGQKSISQKELAELLNAIALWGYNVHRWFQETMRARAGLPIQYASDEQGSCGSERFTIPPGLILQKPDGR